MNAEIAIIGGTGIYNTDLITNEEKINIQTPYGETSDQITTGVFMDKKIAFNYLAQLALVFLF